MKLSLGLQAGHWVWDCARSRGARRCLAAQLRRSLVQRHRRRLETGFPWCSGTDRGWRLGFRVTGSSADRPPPTQLGFLHFPPGSSLFFLSTTPHSVSVSGSPHFSVLWHALAGEERRSLAAGTRLEGTETLLVAGFAWPSLASPDLACVSSFSSHMGRREMAAVCAVGQLGAKPGILRDVSVPGYNGGH